VLRERVTVQLIAVIVGAVLTGVVAILYSSASGSWQQSVRDETERTAARQEQVRRIYGDEAPVAFRVAVADIRARALRPIKDTSRLAASEQTVAAQAAFQLRRISPPDSLVGDPRYALPNSGFDVPRRLTELTRTEADPPDPGASRGDGDTKAVLAGAVAVITVIFTGVATVAAAMPRRRGRDDAADDPQLIPQLGLAAAERRRITMLLLVLWAAGVLLPLVQLGLAGEEQRSQAAAARTAVHLSGQIAVGLTRSEFELNALRDATFVNVAATSREFAAVDASPADAPAELAMVRAEEAAAADVHDVAVTMGQVPAVVDGLDEPTVAGLRSGENDWEALLARQNAEADRADLYGDWSNAAVAAIAGVLALTAWFEVVAAIRKRPTTAAG
jgi:hypothetical protein